VSKRLSIILIVLTLCVIGTSVGFAAEYDIRLGHVENDQSAVHKTALEFKSLIEERTNGEVNVIIFPNSQLGSGTEQVQMLQTGSLNMGIIPAGHMGSIFPEIQIFDIPFLLPDNLEDADKVINGPASDVLFSYLQDKDLFGISNFALGLKQYTANEPIRTPEDFEGLRFRTMSSPLIVESFELLNANPTVIDYHELYTALQLGQVVGHENPYWGIGRMRFQEVQDYIIESNHGLYTNTLLASNRWFENLPEDIKNEIIRVGKEITEVAWKEMREEDIRFKEEINEDPDTEIIELTEEERNMFRERLAPIKSMYVELVGESGEEIMNAFVEESKEFME